ncbi:sulfate transporter 1.3 [Tanacetum coccineum]|uniref:Sulfate transporter 1.3 n=1 Tax=Tanacetum coccineum TaxID=301880 RepID=A0ABQ5EID9_9ASTR
MPLDMIHIFTGCLDLALADACWNREAVAIGRTFASMKDYQVNGNKEMVALRTMNIERTLEDVSGWKLKWDTLPRQKAAYLSYSLCNAYRTFFYQLIYLESRR